MLVWKENFSIGMELIDTQHKHLFDIGNQAYLLLENGLKVDKYDDIALIIEAISQHYRNPGNPQDPILSI